MPRIRKIFPSGVNNTIQNSFKLVFVSEGYTANQQSDFLSDCKSTLKKILETPPFNITYTSSFWLSTYAVFEASKESGAAITEGRDNRTVLDSVIAQDGSLSLSNEKLADLLAATSFSYFDEEIPLTNVFRKGRYPTGLSGGLIVVLIPKAEGAFENGAEYENILRQEEDYYFLATTKNGLWHQVVMNGIAKMLGLGIEYALEGEEYEAPPTDQYFRLPRNLAYFDEEPSGYKNAESKWGTFFSATKRQESIELKPSAEINSVPTTPNEVGFWKGGGGYRKKIYRSANDCLMRRAIGNNSLPVRTQKVPFCFVCREYLKDIIQ